MMRRSFLCAVTALLATAAGAAESGQIRAAVESYMNRHAGNLARQLGDDTRVEYSIALPDAQLAVAPCPAAPEVSTRDGNPLSTRVSVLVSCGNSWSVQIPVDLAIFRPVVVATRTLSPGSLIGADDVQLVKVDVTRITGEYLPDLDAAVGMSAKRPLTQGRPVTAQQIVPPVVIRRGEAVVISAATASIAVKMSGVAMTDGRRGEQIRIKNQGSSRIIEARVIGPGQVEAQM